MPTPSLRLTNGPGAHCYAGRAFNIRVVRRGDRYGRNLCLTHDEREPMVEVYDARFEDDDRFHRGLGQFVSRYYASTLAGTDGFSMRVGTEGGLSLDLGVDEWTIDADAARVLGGFALGLVEGGAR